MTSLLAFAALVGVLAAIAFFLSARSSRAALAAARADAERLRGDGEARRQALADARAEAKERRDEAGQLRADLEKTKKRAFEQQEAAKRLGGAQALREEIDKLGARLAEARAEADHQAARARTLDADLAKVRAALEQETTRPALVAPPPAPVAPAPAPAAPRRRSRPGTRSARA